MSDSNTDNALIELAAAALGLEGFWDTVPGVTPSRKAFYLECHAAGTMTWTSEWNPLRDDHTRYGLIRELGLLTRNRHLLDKHIAALKVAGMPEALAVDRAIVCAAAEVGQGRR